MLYDYIKQHYKEAEPIFFSDLERGNITKSALNQQFYSYVEAKEKFAEYIAIHGIKRNDVDCYIRKYPMTIFKYYYELELDHVLA